MTEMSTYAIVIRTGRLTDNSDIVIWLFLYTTLIAVPSVTLPAVITSSPSERPERITVSVLFVLPVVTTWRLALPLSTMNTTSSPRYSSNALTRSTLSIKFSLSLVCIEKYPFIEWLEPSSKT